MKHNGVLIDMYITQQVGVQPAGSNLFPGAAAIFGTPEIQPSCHHYIGVIGIYLKDEVIPCLFPGHFTIVAGQGRRLPVSTPVLGAIYTLYSVI